mmetsp:Transcript_55117/g.96507  ORF Transcript_55117/g.96507 Transcript_55117/m.96507 type:complete len:217 (+) Transcript_55117:242-892(+)
MATVVSFTAGGFASFASFCLTTASGESPMPPKSVPSLPSPIATTPLFPFVFALAFTRTAPGRPSRPAFSSSSLSKASSNPRSESSSLSPDPGATLFFLLVSFLSGCRSIVASLSFSNLSFSLWSLLACSFFLIISFSFSLFLRSLSRFSAFLSLAFFFFFLSVSPASSFCFDSKYKVRQSTERPSISRCMALNLRRMRFIAYLSMAAFFTRRRYSR